MPPTIREPASPDERDKTIDILRELWTDESPESIEEFFEEPGYRTLCAFDDDESVVGAAGISVQRALHHERHVWVHDLVVTEDRRGDGIGQALMSAVEDWAQEQDLDLVALATIADNDGARDFYDENGYDEWGVVHERRL